MKKQNMIVMKVQEESLLLEFLYQTLDSYPKKKVKSFLTHGNILVNDVITTKYNVKLKSGMTVKLVFGKVVLDKKKKALPILYEDNEFVVINKPAGLLTVATEKEKENTAYHMVKEHVKARNPKDNIYVVHRLDQDTSGILLFTKNEKLKEVLQENWNDFITKRQYFAIVEGNVSEKQGTIKNYLKENKNKLVYVTKNKKEGKLAITHYQVMKVKNGYTLLNVLLDTGRKNQIRVHMKELGYPITGDKKYGAKTNPIKRLGLHAKELGFIHPITKKKYRFEAPVPVEFKKLMK